MPEPRPESLPDPLIDEVRAIRRAILEECDSDLPTLVARLREIERQDPARVVQPEGVRTPTP